MGTRQDPPRSNTVPSLFLEMYAVRLLLICVAVWVSLVICDSARLWSLPSSDLLPSILDVLTCPGGDVPDVGQRQAYARAYLFPRPGTRESHPGHSPFILWLVLLRGWFLSLLIDKLTNRRAGEYSERKQTKLNGPQKKGPQMYKVFHAQTNDPKVW